MVRWIGAVYNGTRRVKTQDQIHSFGRWVLEMDRPYRQGWLWHLLFQKKEPPSASSVLVFGQWCNWKRFFYRPCLQKKKLCKSRTSKKGYSSAECFGKQQWYWSNQCSKNSLLKWSSIRQEVGETALLFNLSCDKDKKVASKVEGTSSFGRSLIYAMD